MPPVGTDEWGPAGSNGARVGLRVTAAPPEQGPQPTSKGFTTHVHLHVLTTLVPLKCGEVTCFALYDRYFDAARSYGRAEEFLGSWLGGLGREQLDRAVVGSKWGYYYTADWQVGTIRIPVPAT